MAGAVARAAIALGSNVGDRAAHLRFAIERLSSLLADIRVSGFVETEPVGVAPQPLFLNAVVVGDVTLSPGELLAELQHIEQAAGRVRPFPGSPRTLDLDLILHGDTVVVSDALTVPHPRFRERAFVLDPLAEIAPDLVDPVTCQPVAALQRALPPHRAAVPVPPPRP